MQPAAGYRVAIDPIFLAAAVAAAPGDAILDAGCGTGAAALCLWARQPRCEIVGVEREAEAAGLARANVQANDAGSKIAIVETEISAYVADKPGTFQHVMINPPFHEAGRHTASPHTNKAASHGEKSISLDGWIKAAAIALAPGGRLVLVHRADRIGAILRALEGPFGAARIFPLWPRTGQEAKRILVGAIKGRRTLPRLLAGLLLHEADGSYTPAAEAVLRDAAPLDFDWGAH
jgi:tRNA1(Val) A37 N6-methylase TrmN6